MSAARLYPAQWRLAAEVLSAVVQQGRAADRLLQAAFREQRQMGGRDRARVTDLLYGALRDLRRLRCIAASDSAQHWLALYALDSGFADVARLQQLGVDDAAALQSRLQ
ncbi:MAG: hypothetical protein WC809_16485, partial [Sinimarinibacterium sp.]